MVAGGTGRGSVPSHLSPAAASRREDLQSIVGLEANCDLVAQAHAATFVATRPEPVLTYCAGISAGKPPGLRHPAFGDERKRGRLEDFDDFLDPVAPWRGARAAAPLPQSVPQHPHRV